VAFSKEQTRVPKLHSEKKQSFPRKRLMSENIHTNTKPDISGPRELKFLKKQRVVAEVKRAKRTSGKRRTYLEDPIQGMIN